MMAIFLYGVTWIVTCNVLLPVIILNGWMSGDYLLLTFNESGEKPLEVVMVGAGIVCAVIVLCEVLRRAVQTAKRTRYERLVMK